MNKKKKEMPITLANKDVFLFLAGQTNGGHCISEKKMNKKRKKNIDHSCQYGHFLVPN